MFVYFQIDYHVLFDLNSSMNTEKLRVQTLNEFQMYCVLCFEEYKLTIARCFISSMRIFLK